MNPKTNMPQNLEGLADSPAQKSEQKQRQMPAAPMAKKVGGPKAIKPMPDFSDEFKTRFFANIPNGSLSECWEWLGHRTNKGYGTIKYHQVGFLAHRVALYLARKPDSQDLHACHRCDNPLCCNPSHLFWGTHADNMSDMYQKCRANRPFGDNHHSRTHIESRPRGESHALAKLSGSQVTEIRRLYAQGGITHQRLSEIYGLSRRLMSSITNRTVWTHI